MRQLILVCILLLPSTFELTPSESICKYDDTAGYRSSYKTARPGKETGEEVMNQQNKTQQTAADIAFPVVSLMLWQ